MANLLQLHASAGLYGGESVILALSNALRHRGVTPIVGCVAVRDRGTPELGVKAAEHGHWVEYFPTTRSLALSPVRAIRRLVRELDIAVIHAHGYKSNLLGGLAALGTGVPVVTTNHLYPMMPLDDRKLQLYGQVDVKLTSRLLDRIVAVSEGIRDRLVRQGVPEAKVTVIENGIDIAEFATDGVADRKALRESLGIPEDAVVVGSLARLTPQKGQQYLLEAARRLAGRGVPFRLVVAGDGPLREGLAAQAAGLGVADRVTFLGFRRDTRALLAMMDVFVLSSIEEGLPMAMLEAMASRVPVVTTSVGDIPKVIRHLRNGILVPPRDSAGLADALHLVITDPEVRTALAAEAHRTVVSAYSQEAMCEKYLAVYHALRPGVLA